MERYSKNKFNSLILRFLIFFFSFNIVLPAVFPVETYAAKKTKKKTTKKKTTKKRSTKKKTTKKNYKPEHTFLIDTLLAEGISYKRVLIKLNKYKNDIHILQVNLTDKKTTLKTIKAGNNIMELEKLPEMLQKDSENNKQNYSVIGGVNANFWRVYTNYPVGPTIVEGEVAEMPTHKKWTSTFLNDVGEPFMGYFKLQGEILVAGKRINLTSVNRRKDTTGVVMYNRFGGDTIPYINSKKTEELLLKGLDDVLQDEPYDDSTEQTMTLDAYRAELFETQRASNAEYNLKKATLRYIDIPFVNAFVRCEVVSIDTGSVPIKPGHCLISFGKDIDTNLIPKVGETVNMHFWTNIHESELFTSSVSGTPRLVRDGMAQHEAYEEGSKSKRFISKQLPRTAIGFDKDKTKMFLVVADSRKMYETTGVNLAQLADIMEYIGCYNAQNLDGGGSTTMVVNGKNLLNDANPYTSRRISVALAAVKLEKEKEVMKLKRKQRRR